MYDFIRGRLTQRGPDEVVLDVGGVGHELSVSGATAGRLPAVGSEATLFVHDRIKEERAVLYGFASREERQLFLKLLTVSRVGPGIALSLLSALVAGALVAAIDGGDVTALSRVRGVRRRTAERLCVTALLRGPGAGSRLARAPNGASTTPGPGATRRPTVVANRRSSRRWPACCAPTRASSAGPIFLPAASVTLRANGAGASGAWVGPDPQGGSRVRADVRLLRGAALGTLARRHSGPHGGRHAARAAALGPAAGRTHPVKARAVAGLSLLALLAPGLLLLQRAGTARHADAAPGARLSGTSGGGRHLRP